MSENGVDQDQPINLDVTREGLKSTICQNLVQAGVLRSNEAPRYRKILDLQDNLALLKIMLHSHMLREDSGGDIITP